mmetsp:Transcript_9130/g.24067  ORF Transcript_9130/g.24067 Transcript_9130/m.24067 type:complete len:221 (-) Transcript_9130:371-1033(-)
MKIFCVLGAHGVAQAFAAKSVIHRTQCADLKRCERGIDPLQKASHALRCIPNRIGVVTDPVGLVQQNEDASVHQHVRPEPYQLRQVALIVERSDPSNVQNDHKHVGPLNDLACRDFYDLVSLVCARRVEDLQIDTTQAVAQPWHPCAQLVLGVDACSTSDLRIQLADSGVHSLGPDGKECSVPGRVQRGLFGSIVVQRADDGRSLWQDVLRVQRALQQIV